MIYFKTLLFPDAHFELDEGFHGASLILHEDFHILKKQAIRDTLYPILVHRLTPEEEQLPAPKFEDREFYWNSLPPSPFCMFDFLKRRGFYFSIPVKTSPVYLLQHNTFERNTCTLAHNRIQTFSEPLRQHLLSILNRFNPIPVPAGLKIPNVSTENIKSFLLKANFSILKDDISYTTTHH